MEIILLVGMLLLAVLMVIGLCLLSWDFRRLSGSCNCHCQQQSDACSEAVSSVSSIAVKLDRSACAIDGAALALGVVSPLVDVDEYAAQRIVDSVVAAMEHEFGKHPEVYFKLNVKAAKPDIGKQLIEEATKVDDLDNHD